MTKNAIRYAILMPGLGLLVLALSACATAGRYSSSAHFETECDGGGTFVDVRYGDSKLTVHAIAHVRRGGALEFRLKPDRRASDEVNYETVKVEIEGAKTPAADWIDLEGTFRDSGGKLVVCVPEDADTGTHYYEIRVEGVGTLDPRADVT